MITETLIIGAGVAGLTLARRLSHPAIILEKSRGVGGRIATRRIDGEGLDHGAPYLAYSEKLKELYPEFCAHENNLFVKGGMTQFPKSLMSGLDIRKDERAEKLSLKNNLWTVETDKGTSYLAKRVVLTCPLPQSLELIKKNQLSYPTVLDSIFYSKALMLLMTLRNVPQIQHLHPDLHSVLFMRERGLHPNGVVVRASEAFSEENFEENDEKILTALTQRFLASLKMTADIDHIELRKWRYVLPKKALDCDFIQASGGLYLIGDAFRTPDIRGSISSAEALAAAIKE